MVDQSMLANNQASPLIEIDWQVRGPLISDPQHVSICVALEDPQKPSKLRRWWWLRQMALGEWLIAWSKK